MTKKWYLNATFSKNVKTNFFRGNKTRRVIDTYS